MLIVSNGTNEARKVESDTNAKEFHNLSDMPQFISHQVSELSSKVDGTDKKMSHLL